MLRPAEIVAAEMAATRDGAEVFTLPSGIASKDDFFDVARTVFPLNPPLGRDDDNWEALRDSIWSGLDDLGDVSVVIIWPDPWMLADFDPEAGAIAAEILSELPEDLADAELTEGRERAVTTILGTRGV